MGVHYLCRKIERVNARLPMKITFNDDPYFETDKDTNDIYRQIRSGCLKSIGIDGSVFIHSHIIADRKKEEGDIYTVYIEKSADEISTKIVEYVKIVLYFFEHFAEESTTNIKKKVLIHMVIDGKPPAPKNRKNLLTGRDDPYSQMDKEDKQKLHKELIALLRKKVADIDINNKYDLILLSNEKEKNRGEGEIQLYSMCKKINEKYRNNNNDKISNVIISPDSDVIAMMAFEKDYNMVILSPTRHGVFITNLALMVNGLKLTLDEFINYVVLHFIFFGSDYNAGLMTNPTESKQTVLYHAVKKGCDDLNEIGRGCLRRLNSEKKKRREDIEEDTSSYLEQLKNDLVFEAICSMRYYKSLGEKSILTEQSPFLYRDEEKKRYIPLISFQRT